MPSDSKYLLITADDFGVCHSINAGIIRAFQEGVLQSTTIMAPCPWFSEAIALTKKYQLPVGLHLTLTCEWDHLRWGPITRSASLMDREGYFPRSFEELATTAKDEDLIAEYSEQIERLRATGIEPTHIDMHMLGFNDGRPEVERFKRLAREFAKKHDLILPREYDGSASAYVRREMFSTGEPSAVWSKLETCDEPGVYHLITHPAVGSAELDSLCNADHPAMEWAAPVRVTDLTFLTKSATRERLKKLGFTLINVPTWLRMRNS